MYLVKCMSTIGVLFFYYTLFQTDWYNDVILSIINVGLVVFIWLPIPTNIHRIMLSIMLIILLIITLNDHRETRDDVENAVVAGTVDIMTLLVILMQVIM